MAQAVTVLDMLNARDKRVERQQKFLETYSKPIISFTMNIAGEIKRSNLIDYGFKKGVEIIKDTFTYQGINCLDSIITSLNTGNEAIFVLDADAITIKTLSIEIEENVPIGRLFDIDVIDNNGKKIDRELLNFEHRRCLLCDNQAQICARGRVHTLEDIINYSNNLLTNFMEKERTSYISKLAIKALLFELVTTPKPGLVDCNNKGSHKDMDIFTFISSTTALIDYFEQCALAGMKTATLDPIKTFDTLRWLGKQAEQKMFSATKGVNTHKGAIFSMGIICGAVGRLQKSFWKEPAKILEECVAMTEGLIAKDYMKLTQQSKKTMGEKLFLEKGITGIRGEMEKGLPAVLNIGLPILIEGISKGYDINKAGSATLLGIMANIIDTNLIARSDYQTQQSIVKKIEDILKGNKYPDVETLMTLDKDFIKKNLSPGGSADLLAICYMLYFLKNENEGILDGI